MKKIINWLLIVLLMIPVIIPSEASAANSSVLPSQDQVVVDGETRSTEYITLEWLSQTYNIPQADLLQQLNKGYSLLELKTALERNQLDSQGIETLLNRNNPKVLESLNSMDFSAERFMEKEQTAELNTSTLNKKQVTGQFVETTGETKILSDKFHYNQILSPSVGNSVYSSVYKEVYGTSTDLKFLMSTYSNDFPTTYDELAVKRLDMKVNGAPYSVGGNENVSLLDGSLQLEQVDMVLPGRNGLSFALNRRYSSSDAIYYDKELFGDSVYWISYYPGLKVRLLNQISGERIVPPYGYAPDFEFVPDWGSWKYYTFLQYMGQYTEWKFPSYYPITQDFNNEVRRSLEQTWSKVDPDDPHSPVFMSNENIYLSGTPLIAKAYTTGEAIEYPGSRKAVCLETNSFGTCIKFYYAYANKIKSKVSEENRFPIGKGWSWDIPHIEVKANNKRYITLFGGSTYELDGTKLKGYPWKDITLSYDNSVTVNNVSSYYVLANINGQKQYFSLDGRLLQISDPYNNTIQFEYSDISPYGKVLTKVKDAIQNEMIIAYTASGVTLTQGDRTVIYTKVKDPQGNKELLSQVTDAQGRTTSYVYHIARASFDLIGNGRTMDNYAALLKQVYHPTKARTDYNYSGVTRSLGQVATETIYRTAWREDVVTSTDGLEQKYNRVDYSYNGDGGAVKQSDSSFSTTINNGRIQSTYSFDKVYIDDNTPEVVYNTQVKHSDGSKHRIDSMEYDRANRRPSPIKIKRITEQGAEKSSETITLKSYDEYGNVTSETDPNQIVVTYKYDPNTHLLIGVSNPVTGGLTSYTELERYSTTNSIRAVRVRENLAEGELKSQTSFAYDAYGNPTVTTIKDNTRDIHVNFQYSPTYDSGYLTSQSVNVTNVDGAVSTVTQSFEYKKATGEMTKYIDGNGYVSEYTYDKLGRLTHLKNPDQSIQTVQYIDTANEVKAVDPTGVTTITKWNPLGWKVSSGIVGKGMQTFGYDTYGRLDWSEDGANNRTTYQYSKWDRLLTTTYPGSAQPTSSISYDDINRIVWSTDPEGNKTKVTSDILGRTIKTESYTATDVLTGMADYTYDHVGNITSLTDGAVNLGGQTTQYAYDVLGRLVSVTDPEGNTTKHTYSMANYLTEVQYPDHNKTVKKYDEMGRLIQKTDPSGQIEKYYYDANSNLTTVLDRKGQTRTYGYNNRDFLTSQVTQNETITQGYDEAGRRLWMQDQTGTTNYSYEPTTRWLSSVTYSDQRSIQYQYDNQGMRTQMTDPFGIVTVYDYDERSRLEAVGPAVNNWDVTYQYKANSLPSGIQLRNGVSSTYEYNELNLTSLTQTKAGGAAINAFSYEYDVHRNQKRKTDNGINHTFTYDKLNRINTSTLFNEDYSYDSRGNRASLSSDKPMNMMGSSYQYDDRNRLTQVSIDNGINVGYRYNRDGLLVERTENGLTTRYYYDGANMIAEGTVGSGGSAVHKASYVRGNQLVARVDANGSKAYYVHNGHGDVVGLTDGAGNVLNQYTYDIWGNPITEQESVPNPFRYSGEFWDESTQLQYLRARWYDPSMGRFINEDTYEGDISNPLTLNLYTYVANNPLKYKDPTGHVMEIDAKLGLSPADQEAIDRYTEAWDKAYANGDAQGMQAAHDAAYKIRLGYASYGYSPYVRFTEEPVRQIGPDPLSTTEKVMFALDFTPGKVLKPLKFVKKINPCNCFTADTKVLTDEGEKPIEDIEVGDKVLAKSDETGEVAYKEVVGLFQKQADEIYKVYIGDEVIEATAEHPFWLDGKGWTEVKDLKVGDLLVTSGGATLAIDKVEKEPRQATVYNFEVTDFSSYFVSNLGIWVHNCSIFGFKVADVPNMSKSQLLGNLPDGWKYTENNGFVHVKDATGAIRMRIDPPDKVTKYDHVHLFDENGNPLDINGNVVDRKSPDAHIPYKK